MAASDAIAIYGALLSTAIVVRDISLRRRRLSVSMIFGASKDFDETCAVVIVTNVAAQPIFLRHVGLACPHRETTFFEKLKHVLKYRRIDRGFGWMRLPLPERDGKWDFPRVVESGQSIEYWVPFSDLRTVPGGGKGVFRAATQDALGRNSFSDIFKAWDPPSSSFSG